MSESNHWTGDPPDIECTEDNAELCECRECRKWRDNREGPEPIDDTPTLSEQYEAAWALKRRVG